DRALPRAPLRAPELPRDAAPLPPRPHPDRVRRRGPQDLRAMQARARARRARADGVAQLHGEGSRALLHRPPDRHPPSERGAAHRGALVSPRVSIALLTEDKSQGTWRGLKAVVEKLFRRFEDDGYTPRDFEIVPADDDDVIQTVIANRWESEAAQHDAGR